MMRHWFFRALASLLLVLGGWSASRSQELPLAPVEEFIARASEFERQNQWQSAAEIYERALRFYPARPELENRWKKAERLCSLARRYHDKSYTHELLKLDERATLNLYREVLEKIRTHYVERVDLTELVRLGYEGLDMALADPGFVAFNFATERGPASQPLREELERWNRPPVTRIEQAVDEAERVARLGQRYGLERSPAVILEFVTAACEGLDPYSSHLTPNRLKDLYAMIDGSFVGLGVEVRGRDGELEVVHVLPDSPASDAALQPGDWIVAVDGVPIHGMDAEEAANLLRGPAGSEVRVRLRRDGQPQREARMVRREVAIRSVTHSQLLDHSHRVGYLKLTSFQKETVAELDKAVDSLLRQGMQSLVLDLRGNPGGLLEVGLQVANRFVEEGVLLSTRGRSWGQTWVHRAAPLRTWNFPLVVLVDSDSASASEILAGAIKDHHRGTLIGSRTFGKGSVQSIYPLHQMPSGLRLTTAYFYSPNGLAYHRVGVEPQILVSRPRGALGEEAPVPESPDPVDDVQLRIALDTLLGASAAH